MGLGAVLSESDALERATCTASQPQKVIMLRTFGGFILTTALHFQLVDLALGVCSESGRSLGGICAECGRSRTHWNGNARLFAALAFSGSTLKDSLFSCVLF